MSNKKISGSEYGIRFGCGALLGFLVGFFVVSGYFMDSSGPIKNGLIVAIFFGSLAAVLGDRFWEWIKYFRHLF